MKALSADSMLAVFIVLPALFLLQLEVEAENIAFKALQQKSMENALVCDANISAGWWEYASTERTVQADCCTWRGAECAEGIVTTFCLTRSWLFSRYTVHVHFLPPTLRFLHIKAALMERFSLRYLPREIRSAFIESAKIVGDPVNKVGTVDLAELPEKLEEAYISVRPQLWGTVYISHVPKTLRCFFLCNYDSIERVVLWNARLPDGLQKLDLLRYADTKPVLVCADAKKADRRVKALRKTSTLHIHWSDYAHYSRTDAMCRQIENEVDKRL